MSSITMLRFLVGTIVVAFVGGFYMTMHPAVNLEVSNSDAVLEEKSLLISDVTPEDSSAYVENRKDVDIAVLGREVARLRAEITKLREHIREIHARLDTLSATDLAAHYEDNEIDYWMAFDENLTDSDLQAQEKAAAAQDDSQSLVRMQTYEANLLAEPDDGAWSIQAVDTIEKAFANQGLSATTLDNIECRTTLCRVNVAHANQEERLMFEKKFIQNVADVLPRAAVHTEDYQDGSSISTFYLARDGYRLPR